VAQVTDLHILDVLRDDALDLIRRRSRNEVGPKNYGQAWSCSFIDKGSVGPAAVRAAGQVVLLSGERRDTSAWFIGPVGIRRTGSVVVNPPDVGRAA
jgi:hypothetical protein